LVLLRAVSSARLQFAVEGGRLSVDALVSVTPLDQEPTQFPTSASRDGKGGENDAEPGLYAQAALVYEDPHRVRGVDGVMNDDGVVLYRVLETVGNDGGELMKHGRESTADIPMLYKWDGARLVCGA